MRSRLLTGMLVSGLLFAPLAAFAADSVKSTTSDAKTFVKDSVITTKVKADLAKTKGVSATHIKVETDANGVVKLSGTAKSQDEADKAVAVARAVKGVTSVDNNIKVE